MNPSILPNRSAPDRSKTDFYPTPANVTIALLDWWKPCRLDVIWEPACGDGRMVAAIKSQGYECVGTELHADPSVDFLATDKPLGDLIITNPPFSKSVAFIEHALTLGLPFAFLLKSQYWHSQRRRELFYRHEPIAVLPLTWRPDFLFGAKRGASTMEVYWTVWGDRPAENTIYQPLKRPRLDELEEVKDE